MSKLSTKKELDHILPDRRHFMEATLVGGIAGASLGFSGCSIPASHNVAYPDADLSYRLDQLDRALEELGHFELIRTFVEQGDNDSSISSISSIPEVDQFVLRADASVQKALRALMFSGVVLDLPERSRSWPEISQRLERYGAEMDDGVLEMMAMLRSCPDQERRHIETMLGEGRDSIMSLCELMSDWSRPRGLGRFGSRRIRRNGRLLTQMCHNHSLDEIIDQLDESLGLILEERGVDPTVLPHQMYVETIWRSDRADHYFQTSSKESASSERPQTNTDQTENEENDPQDCSGENDSASSRARFSREYDVLLERLGQHQYTSHRVRRSMRAGRGLVIGGLASLAACGFGMFLLIAGAAVLASGARRRRTRAIMMSPRREAAGNSSDNCR